jgi:hypothetical protein
MILTKTQKSFQKCQVFYRVIENNSNFLVGATGSPKRGTPKEGLLRGSILLRPRRIPLLKELIASYH